MRIAYPVGRKAIRIIVYPKSVINRLSPNDRLGLKQSTQTSLHDWFGLNDVL